jgi:hypothetical protein
MKLLCVGGPRSGRIVSDSGVEYRFHADQILSELETDDGHVVAVSSYRYIKKQFHYNRRVADVYFWEYADSNVGMELIMDAINHLKNSIGDELK